MSENSIGHRKLSEIEPTNWTFSVKRNGTITSNSPSKASSQKTIGIFSITTNEEIQSELEEEPIEKHNLYPQRWWLVITVILMNLANYSHWVAFPSVAKSVAKHYDQPGEIIDLIPTVSYGCAIPFTLVATYVVESSGLKTGLLIGGLLTGLGKFFSACLIFNYTIFI